MARGLELRAVLEDLETLKFYIVRGSETLYGHLSVASLASP